jgi:hypothetical protein
MAWVVEFYQEPDGDAPVEQFLDGLPTKHRAKLLALIANLAKHGPTLPFPYSSQVDGKLRELRTQFGKSNLRVLYYCDAQRSFQLLHGVKKDTSKLEQGDINKANERLSAHARRVHWKDKSSKEKHHG